jgi:hypothetical protein
MSRSKDTGEHIRNDFDNPENPEGQDVSETPEHPGGTEDPEGRPPEGGGETNGLSIEEHAEKLKVGKPIVAAVMQAEGWAAGKRVTEAVFKTAIDTFLNAPMNGEQRPPESGKEKPPEGVNSNGTA